MQRGILAILAAAAAWAQNEPARPEFEVASIRPSAPYTGAGQLKVGVHIDGAQVNCIYLSLKDYIRMGYQVKDYQIVGPEWLASARFDITAKIPGDAAQGKVRDMVQALLADRFQMKMHRDTKELPVYGLVVAKGGLKMKESAPDADAAAPSGPSDGGRGTVNVTATGGPGGTTVSFGMGSYFALGDNRFEAKKLTMANLAETLARFVDRPVVDMTQISGNYDFTLEFSPEDYRAMMIRSALAAGVVLPPQAMQLLENSSGDSLLNAMQTVGLKLEPRKAPLDVLVIDRIEKSPTEN